MTLLEIDNKAVTPPPPLDPASLVAPAAVGSGEPGTDQIWQEPASCLLARLKTKISGLTTAESRSQLAIYGANDASEVKTVPLWLQFLARFRNPLVIILLVASGLSAATGDMASFSSSSVIVTMSINSISSRKSAPRMRSRRCAVGGGAGDRRRDGASVSVPIDQLVPGDIVELIAGDLVPADSRLLESRDLFVNQALLTGEPYPGRESRPATPPPARKTPPARRTPSSPALR